jgi:hypothetical protein
MGRLKAVKSTDMTDDTTNAIVRRVLREAAIPELMEVLTKRLSMPDLQSLLLETYRKRTATLSPAALLNQYRTNRFVRPAGVSPQQCLEFDRLGYSLLPQEFECLELSPVSPLGVCSVLATVDQNNAVTTIRNTEVCSDATNVLALECATRRQKTGKRQPAPREVKLCASHRLLRGQVFKGAGMVQHFRVFSLCTAGADSGSSAFEAAALVEHMDFYIRLLKESARLGFSVQHVRATVTPFAGGREEVVERQILAGLATQHPDVSFELDRDRKTGAGYYIWAGFQIMASDAGGSEWFLVDGGFTNWTQLLLNNRKERLLISGLGTDRFLSFFSQREG